ncbi:TPA: restriction endonuclease subunit S [Staphylococcus aureus]|uniref:restriction endonuclease subunit S n=1 Tax=Staphylococcus aureus TaxID=1280 RepID=UPI0007695916|nr:restriction endonuclease subunit S [Staphylococcus aureus]MBO8573477.1 restriction endonuclease subunit S [Staphylococcus aureus]MBU5049895.1 restriction endonuclease subunit S [Staphylococcus aureus]CYA37280.1 type I restriction-modification system S subunit [Staphylococcus aureus]SGV71463.1 type I restriction-modification system S subunit [Staphylococcus aureus]SGX40212.1 type I restriction-modification system S subunit [Staphylococcus aureus]
MSNTQKKNVPELRFPGFEGEWEEKKLGEVGTFTSGGTPLKSKSEYWNGDIPWITTGDIHNIKRENITNFITEKGLNESSAKLITNEAILIAMYGQGKTRGMSAILNFEATTNQACAIYQTNQNINFVFQYFQKLYEFLRSLSNEGSQKNLSLSLLKEITLNYPNEQEQKKIGDFFSKLDRQIELEEQKLELLQQQKKGYMQKIFSQELRFKDENGNDYPDWTNENFKDLFKVVPSKKYQIKSSEIIESGKIPVVDQGKKLILGFSNQTDKVYKEFNNVIIYGDHTTIIKKMDVPFIIGGDGVKLLTPISNNNLDYFFSILQYFNIESEGYKRHFSILKDKNFYTANSNKEQQKIGCFFKYLDLIINKQFTYLELLKSYKKGIIQKMFV